MKWFEWKDNIALELPDDWKLNEPGNLIEIVPPDDTGALHISIFERERQGPPEPSEAVELIKWFQRKRGAISAVRAFRDRSEVASARATFSSTEGRTPMHWLVLAKVWPGIAVLATFCHDPHVEKHVQSAEGIIESIRPVAADMQ